MDFGTVKTMLRVAEGETGGSCSIGADAVFYRNRGELILTRVGERRLLAGLAAEALPETAFAAIPRGLAAADALAAQGEPLRALQEVTHAYETAVKLFDGGLG